LFLPIILLLFGVEVAVRGWKKARATAFLLFRPIKWTLFSYGLSLMLAKTLPVSVSKTMLVAFADKAFERWFLTSFWEFIVLLLTRTPAEKILNPPVDDDTELIDVMTNPRHGIRDDRIDQRFGTMFDDEEDISSPTVLGKFLQPYTSRNDDELDVNILTDIPSEGIEPLTVDLTEIETMTERLAAMGSMALSKSRTDDLLQYVQLFSLAKL
jgi:hypothetical protein